MKLLLLLVFIFGCTSAEKRSYDGYQVYRFVPTKASHLEFLQKLESDSAYEIWNDIIGLDEFVDVMVDPYNGNDFQEMVKQEEIDFEILFENLQDLISDDHVERDSKDFSWDKYYDLDGIYSWMQNLTLQYPGVVSVITADTTYEGREIRGIKISRFRENRAVFIEGGIHAREWISPATVTYIVNELLTNSSNRVQRLLRNFDFYVFPVTNPDGYVFTHTTDRVWRKTRKPYPTALNCTGVDPNRNWNFEWGVFGTSTNSCSNTFGGPFAFSEPETTNLGYYIDSIASKLDVYLSFHSYAQTLLIPYGNSTDKYGNFDDLLYIGTKSIEALREVHNTTYRVGNTAELMSLITGSSTDWVKHTYGTPITFTYELRHKDTSKYGFILPPEFIIPTSEEIFESILVMFEEAAKLDYFPKLKLEDIN